MSKHNYKNFVITVQHDENPLHPRQEMDNLSKLFFFGKMKGYGDEHNLPEPSQLGITTVKDHTVWMYQNFPFGTVVVPVRGYVHSGVSFSLSNEYPYNDKFDSGCAGFAVVTQKDAFEAFKPTDEKTVKEAFDKCLSTIESELQTLNKYIAGESYVWTVHDHHGALVEAVGGYDDPEFALKEGVQFVDEYIKTQTPKKPEPTQQDNSEIQKIVDFIMKNPAMLQQFFGGAPVQSKPASPSGGCNTCGTACKPPTTSSVFALKDDEKPAEIKKPSQPVNEPKVHTVLLKVPSAPSVQTPPVPPKPVPSVAPANPPKAETTLDDLAKKLLTNPKTGKPFSRKDLTGKRVESIANEIAKHILKNVK